MATNIFKSGNYIIFKDSVDTSIQPNGIPAGDFRYILLDDGATISFFDRANPRETLRTEAFSNIVDEAGDAYTNLDTFVTFLRENTGNFSGGGGASLPTQDHRFDTIAARDTYFTSNPGELRTGLPIFVTDSGNTVYEIWGGNAQSTYDATSPTNDDDKWVQAGTFTGTAATIKSLYESNSDTNAFTDSEKTKLSGIETAATADQTDAEIKTAYENNADTNAFTDADHTKLDGIEAGATADQTGAEIKAAYEGEDDTNAFTDTNSAALQNSVQEIAASATANTITVTREDGDSFDVTIINSQTGIVPPVTSGEILNLRPPSESWDASSGAFPTGAQAGYTYIVSTAGDVDGVSFKVDDLIIALVDSASTSNYDDNWHKVEGGVHSWGGLYGIITDQNIIDKLTRLGYIRNTSYAAPSVHNFSINIASRVDLNTDLNIEKTLSYDITNRNNISSFELIVTTGDNKNLTNPTIDGSQTQNVTLSGIDTSSQSTLTFVLRITDTQNNTHNSNTITINVQDAVTHEQTHFGHILSTEDQTDIVFANDDVETRDSFAGDWTVSGIPTDSNLYRIYWAVPTSDGSITRVSQGGFTLYEDGLSSGNQFTEISNVTIDSRTYNVLLLNAANAVNNNYNGTRLTIS